MLINGVERKIEWGAYLVGADLRGADLADADLRDADLRGADLRGADLREAYLVGADLRDAYLEGADLRGANLREANGIYQFGGIGEANRIGCAYFFEGETFFRLGCFTGNLKEAVKAIRAKYGAKSTYEAQVRLTAKIMIEKYGGTK